MWCLVLRARNFITDRRGSYIIINMSIEFFSYAFVLVEILLSVRKKNSYFNIFRNFASVIWGIAEKSSLRFQSVSGVFEAPCFAKVHTS